MRGEFVDLDGARLYYYAAGTRGAGEPVVLLHGFPTSGHLWSEVVPFVPAGHRVVVLDLLGYGRSDRPRGRSVSLRGHADRVVRLFDSLGIAQACLVGHDIGGGIAQSIAVRYPDRVSRVCLVDSVAFDDWPPRLVRMVQATLPVGRRLPPPALITMLRRGAMRGYADRTRGAHSVAQYVRPFSGSDGRDSLVEHLRALDPSETTQIADRLGAIDRPAAIVWGADDPFLPVRIAHRLQQSMPHASLDIIEGARHFTPEEVPQRIGDALGALLRR